MQIIDCWIVSIFAESIVVVTLIIEYVIQFFLFDFVAFSRAIA